MPAWLPWIFIGGIVFMILSFLASKYQEKEHKPIAFAQDFIGGAVVVSLLGTLVPDSFPALPVLSKDMSVPNLTSMLQTVNGDNDIDLQVGPIRR
jgi:hypothetical protein